MSYAFDLEKIKTFECALKHGSILHQLLREHRITITATQMFETEGNVDDILAKLLLLSSITKDVEEFLTEYVKDFLLKNIAPAIGEIRVSNEDVAQLIMEIGHLGSIEEHFADYMDKYVSKFMNAKTNEEKKELQEKIIKLASYAYNVRQIRKKLLGGFIKKLEL